MVRHKNKTIFCLLTQTHSALPPSHIHTEVYGVLKKIRKEFWVKQPIWFDSPWMYTLVNDNVEKGSDGLERR